MRSRMSTAVFIALLVTGTAANGRAEGLIGRREARQQERIAQGISSGRLTAGEAARLEKGEQRIAREREKASADGKLTPREKGRLEHHLNQESHKINKMKHNSRKAK